MLQLRKPWDSQPQEAVGVNGESPYAQNLVTCIPLHPQWGMRNLVTGAALTRTGLAGTVVGPHGLYPSFGTSNYCDFDSPAAITSGTQPVTIAWDQYPVATSAYSTILNWKPNGAANSFLIYQSSTDANYYFSAGPRLLGITKANWSAAIGAATNARYDRYVLVCGAGTDSSASSNYRLYRNGVLQTRSVDTQFGTNSTASARIGAVDGGTDVFEGAIGNFCIWNEAFSDAKAEAYDPQRWQLFAPRSIWVPVTAATGGAYTLTADAGAYAIGGQDAALVKSRIVVADAGAYSLAGQDATLTYAPAAGAYTLTAEPGAYVLAGQDAALKRGRVVSADAGAYALAGQDATLTYALANAYTLTCEAGAYAIGGQAATIAFSGATQATTGGWLGQRRRTKREIDNDWRKLVGLDPIEDEPDYLSEAAEVAEAVKPQRKTITVASLKPINVDNFVNAIKAKKRRRDEEFLLLMD